MTQTNQTHANRLYRQLIQNGVPLTETDHNSLLVYDRRLYAGLTKLNQLRPSDGMQIIMRLLAVTEDNGGPVSLSVKQDENLLIANALRHYPFKTVLEWFLELMDRKVNNQRTSGVILSYLLGSASLEKWAISHRGKLRRLFRHVMGKHKAQNCVHFLLREGDLLPHQVAYLQKNLYRYGTDKQVLKEVFLFLFGELENATLPLLSEYEQAKKGLPRKSSLPYRTLKGIANTYYADTSKRSVKFAARKEKLKRETMAEKPEPTTLTDHTVEWYKSGGKGNPDQVNSLFSEAILNLPRWEAKIEVIIDNSLSMAGTGSRAFNSMAIAANIGRMFKELTPNANISFSSGNTGDENYPQPAGATALGKQIARAILKAPDLVVIVSDGYENVEMGDAANVLTSLRNLGYSTPVVQVAPVFTDRENLSERTLFPGIAPIPETGQKGFFSLWLQLHLEVNDHAESILREFLELTPGTRESRKINV